MSQFDMRFLLSEIKRLKERVQELERKLEATREGVRRDL